MTGVDLRIDTQQVGQIGMLDKPSVKHLLSKIIEFVGIDSSLYSKCIISLLSDDFIEHFGEPPNTWDYLEVYRSYDKRFSRRKSIATLYYDWLIK